MHRAQDPQNQKMHPVQTFTQRIVSEHFDTSNFSYICYSYFFRAKQESLYSLHTARAQTRKVGKWHESFFTPGTRSWHFALSPLSLIISALQIVPRLQKMAATGKPTPRSLHNHKSKAQPAGNSDRNRALAVQDVRRLQCTQALPRFTDL